MEKPSEIMGNIQTRGEFRALRTRAEQEKRPALGSKEIPADHPLWDVWEQIKSFYPGSTANWDHEPPIVWYVVLEDLTVDQLINGVKNLVRHSDPNGNNSFPPNAGQFRDLCLSNFDWQRQCHKIHESVEMIEDIAGKEKRIEHGRRCIAEIRELFA